MAALRSDRGTIIPALGADVERVDDIDLQVAMLQSEREACELRAADKNERLRRLDLQTGESARGCCPRLWPVGLVSGSATCSATNFRNWSGTANSRCQAWLRGVSLGGARIIIHQGNLADVRRCPRLARLISHRQRM